MVFSRSPFRQDLRIRIVGLCFAAALAASSPAFADDQKTPQMPAEYLTNYPDADKWCPPIRSAFIQAQSTTTNVPGKGIIHHKANGGYGLQVVSSPGTTSLHMGADLGWYEVGEPVFAVGNGVVRISNGPAPPEPGSKTPAVVRDTGGWGNLVVIEHRWPVNGEKFYTLYAHLAELKTGNCIGRMGQTSRIADARNWMAIAPHLHFEVRDVAGHSYDPVEFLRRFLAH